jgi:PAS domain S-box-containing protein
LDEAAIVIADTTGVIHFWSKGAERSFGHSAASAVGRSLDLIVPAEFREAHWAGFRRAIAAGSAAIEGQPITLPVLKADGDIENSPGRLTILRAGEGRMIGCMVIFG